MGTGAETLLTNEAVRHVQPPFQVFKGVVVPLLLGAGFGIRSFVSTFLERKRNAVVTSR